MDGQTPIDQLEELTDVNIAIRMIQDAQDNATDSIVLVSGDSDQEPAIHWIHDRFLKISLTVYIPVLPSEAGQRRIDFYGSIGVSCTPLPLDGLTAHQLPPVVKLYEGGVSKGAAMRPKEWAITT